MKCEEKKKEFDNKKQTQTKTQYQILLDLLDKLE
jgi:hypothetical protein